MTTEKNFQRQSSLMFAKYRNNVEILSESKNEISFGDNYFLKTNQQKANLFPLHFSEKNSCEYSKNESTCDSSLNSLSFTRFKDPKVSPFS